jgi:hypothetical protein
MATFTATASMNVSRKVRASLSRAGFVTGVPF